MSRTRLALGTAAAVAGTAAMARAVDRRWASNADPCGLDELSLPDGESTLVATDDGAKLAMTVAGSGPTVVLAHCWTGGTQVWSPVAHRLVRAGRRVVLYEQRGHGASTVGSDGLSIPRLGADLRTIIEAVDAQDAVLAGHSMGGMTVQSLAAHHPDVIAARARALVLVSTAAAGLSQGRADRRAERMLGSSRIDRALAGPAGHALVRGVVGKSVARNHLVVTRDLFVACDPKVRAGWFAAMQQMDLRDGIAGVAVPTTVMVGTRDRLTPLSRANEIVAAIPGATLQTLAGYGHMLPLEAPDQVADAILAA